MTEPSYLASGIHVVFYDEPGRATRELPIGRALMCCELRFLTFGRGTPST
jgi:hypothetical protein